MTEAQRARKKRQKKARKERKREKKIFDGGPHIGYKGHSVKTSLLGDRENDYEN